MRISDHSPALGDLLHRLHDAPLSPISPDAEMERIGFDEPCGGEVRIRGAGEAAVGVPGTGAIKPPESVWISQLRVEQWLNSTSQLPRAASFSELPTGALERELDAVLRPIHQAPISTQVTELERLLAPNPRPTVQMASQNLLPPTETLTLHYDQSVAIQPGPIAATSHHALTDSSIVRGLAAVHVSPMPSISRALPTIRVIDLTSPQEAALDLSGTCTDANSPDDIGHLAPEIREFLSGSRVGTIGRTATAGTSYALAEDEMHPADVRKTGRPRAFYRPILAGRQALDLGAVDLQPIKVTPVELTSADLCELYERIAEVPEPSVSNPDAPPSAVPNPGPSSADVSAPEAPGLKWKKVGELPPPDPILQHISPRAREIIPRIYEALLGRDAVYQVDGQWNIATPSGVIDMQARTGVGNPMFTMFCTEDRTFIYFAQEIDPHAVSATPMHMHNVMQGADLVSYGELTIVDARRFIHNQEDKPAPTSAFAIRGGESSTLLSTKLTAERAIAKAIQLAMPPDAITTRMHINRVVDVEKSTQDTLRDLRKITKLSVDYVYLRDIGVMAVNSPVPAIERLQQFAEVNTQLRDQRYVGNAASMLCTAPRLFEEDILKALTSDLEDAHRNSDFACNLSFRLCTGYFLAITTLMSDQVLAPSRVVDALKTELGQRLVNELGRHVGYREMLARAFISVLDQLLLANVSMSTIKSVLVPDEELKLKGFLKALNEDLDSAPHARAVKRELVEKNYAAASTFARVSKAYLNTIHKRTFAMLNIDTRSRSQHILNAQSISNDVTIHRPVETILDILRSDLSMESFVIMAKNNLRHELMELMPTVTVGEQRQFRGIVTDAVNKAWQEKLPGQTAPSSVIQSAINECQPSFVRQLGDARRQARNDIVDNALERFGTFMRDHPDATKAQMTDARNQTCTAAMVCFQSLLSAGNHQTSESAQALAAHSSEKASTSAQAVKEASAVAAAAVAATKRTQHEAESQYLQRATNEARAQAKRAADESTRRAVREIDDAVSRLARESAREKSQRDAKAQASRVAEAQANDAARTYARELEREAAAKAEATAKRLASAQAGPSTSFGAYSSAFSLPSSSAQAGRSSALSKTLGTLQQLPVLSTPIGTESATSTSRSKSKSRSGKEASASHS